MNQRPSSVPLHRRLVAALAAIVVSVVSIIAPIRDTQAAFFIPVWAGAELVMSTGAAWSIAGTAGFIGLLGMTVHAVKLKDSTGAEALRVRLNEKAAKALPSTWTAPTLPAVDPVPPATAAGLPTYSGSGGGGTCTNASSIAQCLADSIPGYPAGLCGGAAPVYTLIGYVAPHMSVQRAYPGTSTPGSCTTGAFVHTVITVGSACPTGYTLSSGTCNLTTPSIVPYPSDSAGQVDLTTGTVTPDSRDPDTVLPPGVEYGSGEITVTTDGGAKRVILKQHGDGTATLTSIEGRGDGTSDRQILTFSPADGGSASGGRTVTGVLKDRVIGEGGSANPNATPGAETTGTQPVPCGLPGSPACKIDETGTPTGTAAHAGAATSVAGAMASLDAKIGEQTSKTLPWAWSFSFPSLTCASWSFTYTPTFSGLSGQTFSKVVDWCPWLTVARDWWGYAVSVITLIYLWRSFTGSFRSA